MYKTAREQMVVLTADGSSSIHLPDKNLYYHSQHGAIAESQHVFIENGLHFALNTKDKGCKLNVLEIGFGSGLNAFMTYLEHLKGSCSINYTGVDAFPLDYSSVIQLNYSKQLKAESHDNTFKKMHDTDWNTFVAIGDRFNLKKEKKNFLDISDQKLHDLIYFDAFAATAQPELWTETLFSLMFKALKSDGVLVTYSAKGSVRRAMQSVGFAVERLPGPPGKREMLRAIKY